MPDDPAIRFKYLLTMEQIEVVLGELMTVPSSADKVAVFKDLHRQWKENRRLLKFLPKPVPKSREEA